MRERQYEFLVERREYGRQVCLAVLTDVYPNDPADPCKMQLYKLVPHMTPVNVKCTLSGWEDESMVLSEHEARELLTALLNAGIRPFD